MRTDGNLRVHVAPVGYEEDRIVLPAVGRRADRVRLLVHSNPSEDRALHFVPRISRKLGAAGIEVSEEAHDRTDLFDIVRCIRRVIAEEADNLVYVNLSSGSKIQAIALMMGCMMAPDMGRVVPFYAEPERYAGQARTQISSGLRGITEVPAYRMQMPPPALARALGIIKSEGGRVTKKRLAELAAGGGIISAGSRGDGSGPASLASLAQNVIRPLEDKWGYVRVDKVGRNRWVALTAEGERVSEFLV